MLCFFLQIIHSLNEKFPSLFENDADEQGDEQRTGRGAAERFAASFGWNSCSEQVAEYERIKLDDVWALPVIQFLNDLVYLKEKKKYLNAKK